MNFVPIRLGDALLGPPVFLAPMAGITDLPFRRAVARHGAGLVVSEMVASTEMVTPRPSTRAAVRAKAMIEENGVPVSVQIAGREPGPMAETARIVAGMGAGIIDINMGCPARKVTGGLSGAALMREPDRAKAIIEAVVKAVPCPVTVKFRKGWDDNSVNGIEFAKLAEEAGAAAVCIHGRTREQMYAGRADWDYMARVVEAVSIPVIVNGDASSPESAKALLEATGAKMALIGRGALGNPWLFAQANAAMADEEIPPLPPLSERLACALRQIQLAAEQKGKRTACKEARKHFVWYLKGVRGAAAFRAKATAVSTLADITSLMEEILACTGGTH